MDSHSAFRSLRVSDPLPLFSQPEPDVPDIRVDAPSSPGSETSRLAAAAIDGPFRRASWRKLMLALGATDALLSMHDLSEQTGLAINVVCARIPELEPLWIERERGACQSHAKAGLRVDGFRLTIAGKRRVRGTA